MRDRKTVEAIIKGERERALANVRAEQEGKPRPVSVWYMSFAEGRFLGGIVMHAENFSSAVQRAHILGINPGGQVLGHLLSPDEAAKISEKWKSRLLTRAECEAVFNEMGTVGITSGDALKLKEAVPN